MVPSFLLYDQKELGDLFEKLLGPSPNQGRNARDPLTSDELDQLRPVLTKFRATPKHVEELRASLRLFEGTKRFTTLQMARRQRIKMQPDTSSRL
jgi:hypothetical protein